jgi:hypothetical protein
MRGSASGGVVLETQPRDNREELMEAVELRRLLQDTEVHHVAKAGRLAILVMDVSKVLVDLGMPPISRILWDPHIVGDILEAMNVILE